MLRPNLAMDPPPECITVNGAAYPAHTDYRVWIQIMSLLREILPSADTPAQQAHNADVMMQIEDLAFGGLLSDEAADDVLRAVLAFARGYPSAPHGATADDGPITYSLDYDLNEIIIAIRNQSGIDLSYRRAEPFHWWLFLLEFRTLCGDHYILRLMDVRGYRGTDSDMRRQQRANALPAEHTAAEREALSEINELFYGAGGSREGNHHEDTDAH